MDIEEEFVEVVERMEWDAVLGNKREVSVRWVVEEGGGEEAAGSGDKSGGGSLCSLRRDDFIGENAGGRGNFDRRVGVDVDIVEIRVGFVEEELPEGEEVEVGVG